MMLDKPTPSISVEVIALRPLYEGHTEVRLSRSFFAEDPKDVARLQSILDELHGQFIALVKERRGDKLADDPDLFTGAFWAAPKAKDLGLIDGTAQLGDFLRARYGKDVKIKRYSPEAGSLLKRLLSGGETNAPALLDADALLAAAERRALWARYGL